MNIKITEEEFAYVVRALKARASMWLDHDHINKDNALSISRTYRELAKKLESQAAASEESMYETVRTVNDYEITRMAGTRGCYHVRLDDHRERTFRTIKAAAEFCETQAETP